MNWKKQFDKEFKYALESDHEYYDSLLKMVKAFIQTLLDKQREEMIKEIEFQLKIIEGDCKEAFDLNQPPMWMVYDILSALKGKE